MTPTYAVAFPHTPWIAERAESFARLVTELALGHYVGDEPNVLSDPHDKQLVAARIFDERESNRVWPGKMWRWALSTNASHLLQLQDDVIVSPNFWAALRAMLEAQPDVLIGLHSNHPLAIAQFKAGRRWYRDRWLTGPAYVFPTALLHEFVAWCDLNPQIVAETNEDSLVCKWCHVAGVDVWHPVPAITDHDLGVPSTYGNDAHHEWSMYRTPPVTWRDMPSLAALEDAAYWRCTETSAPLLPGPGTQLCWFCAVNDGRFTSEQTGCRLCKECVARIVGFMFSRA